MFRKNPRLVDKIKNIGDFLNNVIVLCAEQNYLVSNKVGIHILLWTSVRSRYSV